MKRSFSRSKRKFLGGTMAVVAGTMVSGLAREARSAELPRVTEDEPTAVALKYVHDASRSARPAADQVCHNCRYFKGTQQTEWERCDLFPGKTVNANGWCNVWAMKG